MASHYSRHDPFRTDCVVELLQRNLVLQTWATGRKLNIRAVDVYIIWGFNFNVICLCETCVNNICTCILSYHHLLEHINTKTFSRWTRRRTTLWLPQSPQAKLNWFGMSWTVRWCAQHIWEVLEDCRKTVVFYHFKIMKHQIPLSDAAFPNHPPRFRM